MANTVVIINEQELARLKEEIVKKAMVDAINQQMYEGINGIKMVKPQPKQPQTLQISAKKNAELTRIGVLSRGACVCVIILVILAVYPIIYAILIANNNEKTDDGIPNPCSNTQYYIDLDVYLYIAVVAQLGFFIVFALAKVIMKLLFSREKPTAFLATKTLLTTRLCRAMSILYPLFLFVWACVGFNVY
eukprot:486863_1